MDILLIINNLIYECELCMIILNKTVSGIVLKVDGTED